MGVWVQVVVVTHEVLPQKYAGIEPTSDLGVDLVGIVHQLFKFLRQSHHSLGQSGQQFLNEVKIFVVFLALDCDCLSFEVVEGYLEVDLLKLFDESLCFSLFVKFHSNETDG